jgi:hypothetical protein
LNFAQRGCPPASLLPLGFKTLLHLGTRLFGCLCMDIMRMKASEVRGWMVDRTAVAARFEE